MLRFLLAGLFMLIHASASAEDAALTKGRAAAAAFLAGDMDGIWNDMTPELRSALGDKKALYALQEQLARDHGQETGTPREEMHHQGTFRTYQRVSSWSKSGARLAIQFSFDQSERIAGFHVRPVPAEAESRFLDYQTKAKLRLPFDGAWFVYWGGHDIEANYHAVDRAQRFALDLMVLKDGASHTGDPAKPESFYCWDRPILAPADAIVVTAIDGLPDKDGDKIGRDNPKAGNHVVLDLGQGEYAFFAHLRMGSVAVKPADRVHAGQMLGRCGNSGNSTDPHLHFHLQTTPDLQNGEGLPVFFENYVADGKPVARGEPVRGQVIAPAP